MWWNYVLGARGYVLGTGYVLGNRGMSWAHKVYRCTVGGWCPDLTMGLAASARRPPSPGTASRGPGTRFTSILRVILQPIVELKFEFYLQLFTIYLLSMVQ